MDHRDTETTEQRPSVLCTAVVNRLTSGEPVTREDIISAARRYLGAPFRFAGRSARGLDCVGVPLMVARDLEVSGWEHLWADRSCHAYARVRAPGFLRAKLDGFVAAGILRRVDVNRLQPADMVLRFGGFAHDHHVCLLSYDDCLIEARNKPEPRFPLGRLVECAITPSDRRTFMGGYQFKDVC